MLVGVFALDGQSLHGLAIVQIDYQRSDQVCGGGAILMERQDGEAENILADYRQPQAGRPASSKS